MTSSEPITAFEMQDFLARERRRIIGLCATITRHVEVAEDLAQETLYEAWRCRSNLRNIPYADEWLSGIARNVCRRWLQRKSRDEARIHAYLDEIDGEIGAPLEAIPDDLDIEAELERAELAQLLDRAMAQLPVETRAVLRGHFIDETTHAEMALQLGLSENALSVRLHRGKRALRRLLMTDFAESVESYGVTSIASETWTETHIWCSLCGHERLQGRLDRNSSPGKFSLLCRNCFVQTGQLFHNSDTRLLGGVTRFKPALSRVMAWSQDYYRGALRSDLLTCLQCGRHASLSMEQTLVNTEHPDGMRTLAVSCPSCGSVCTQSFAGLVLWLPQSQNFWRAYPRMRTLPERLIETQGHAAIVTSFRSMTNSAQLDVISALDTGEVLSIHPPTC